MKRSDHSYKAIRGPILDIGKVCRPTDRIDENIRQFEDGLLLVKDGIIEYFGPWQADLKQLTHYGSVVHYPGKLIVPGFVDTHIHFPQAEIPGAYGSQLLQWLESFVFPAEKQFGDEDHARQVADFFINQLLLNGTTTASVFCSVHPQSVEALFDAAGRKNLRLIAGKVLMDRNAPDDLLDTPQSGYDQSRALIEKYHLKNRLLYAITPRFAPTSTPEQLALAGHLKAEFPDTYLQTHLSENLEEVKWVKDLFPAAENYFDVYHQHGLTGPRSIFGHCIHLEEQEWKKFQATDSVISFCPTSNLFLGSGLFDMKQARKLGIRVGIATDIGAGTSFGMLRTLSEAYKVLQLQNQSFSPWDAFYSATLGGAKALSLDHLIGNFALGKEADFVILDPQATELQRRQYQRADSLADILFSLMILGDDRSIYHTYVDGRLVHDRSSSTENFQEKK